jgi:MFS family permease
MTFHTRLERHAHRHGVNKGIPILARNSLLVAFAFASIETIWPIFLYSMFQSESLVGYITAGFAVLGIVGLATLYPLFHKYKAREIYYITIVIQSLLFIIYTQLQNKYVFLILAAISVFFSSLRIQAFGILIRENSTKKNITANEGLIYFLMNIGWLLGPLLSGYLANTYSMNVVFVLASICLLGGVYNLTFSEKLEEKKITKKTKPFFYNLKSFFQQKKLIYSYLLSGGLEAWYVLPYIFMPIIILKEGYDFNTIGIFLFAFATPLVIMQYWLKSKKNISTKKLMVTGYFIMALASLGAVLAPHTIIILICFVLAGFGTGLLEPTTESYFFMITDIKQERDYYGTFMTSKIVGSFTGRIIIASILLFTSITWGIATLGVMSLILGLVAVTKL